MGLSGRSPLWRVAAVCVSLACCLGGCSGNKPRSCEGSSQYSSSTSIGPIQVPDDLAVPDESETLLIPGVTGAAEDNAAAIPGCIEDPPPFSEDRTTDSNG